MAVKTWTAVMVAMLSANGAIVQAMPLHNSTLPSIQYQDTLAGVEATQYFVATIEPGEDLSNVTWTEVASKPTAEIEKRQFGPGGPGGACSVVNERHYTVLSSGTWWTNWCHDRRTVWPDGVVLVGQSRSTSITVSSEISISIPKLGDAISAKLGYSITKTKSVDMSQGCHGRSDWTGPHGVWWQEKMGWAESEVEDITYWMGGQQCFHPEIRKKSRAHANWPDPDNTGFRQFEYGCRDAQSDAGPWCNFLADSLQETS
ncbi:hypothetical protein BU23DRAFT_599925 [Bimuria novae-zelandiae CBS 107.79]|uniref:Uncharacterized protein n=1 Tax=Bimuria novae-zelandiae CBS 107.79 TaxID=1447943 RepID=A0A6A5V6T7_9PLEO|nr:hypothetical protein BU23DRAFT_599925 [Bimuria novae-zelandiae CBS 107.79]